MFGEVVKYYFKKLVHRGCTPPLADEFYAEKQVAYLGVPITSAHSSAPCCRAATELVSVMLTSALLCISYHKQSKLYRLVYDDSRQLEWGCQVFMLWP